MARVMTATTPDVAAAPAGRLDRWLSANPAKRAVERYWLGYTVVWGVVAGVIMLGGVAERWGDVELMILGVAFALGTVLPPVLRPHASQVERPWHQRTAFKMGVAVVGFSLLMNYFCTPYFFDVLHMHFGFDTRIVIQNNPFFLYLMTVAYFATYSVLVCMAHRAAVRMDGPLRVPALVAAPFAVAFLETALNANPFMTSLFCFDEMGFMLGFGTFSYGCALSFMRPVWFHVDEEPGVQTPLRRVVVWVMAGMMGMVATFDLLRHHVAPHLTEVETGAQNLRDFGDGCLDRPGE
jgi:hypothetical protein